MKNRHLVAIVAAATIGLGGIAPSVAQQVIYEDDFSGSGGPLDGVAPDVSLTGASWVAAPTFEDDGDSVSGSAGGSATLAFTPSSGLIYTLDASISNIVGDTDWFGVGFANGQSTANSANARFITGDVEGVAWAMYRGAQATSTNQTFLGDLAVEPNSGLASGAGWVAESTAAGGSVDLRLTLDTQGGAGAWKVTMEANVGNGFQVIRATETLLDETISSVGIANSNTADLTGTLESFRLTVVPEPSAAALGLVCAASLAGRRKRTTHVRIKESV